MRRKNSFKKQVFIVLFSLYGLFGLSGLQFSSVHSQGNSFLQNLRLGFGGGVNLSHTDVSGSYEIYEDLAGNEIISEYSPLLKNLGNQYFFRAEYSFSPLVISLQPGTYSYNFSFENTLVFEDSDVIQSHDFTLRYFEIPLDVKYLLLDADIQPFIGGTLSWGTLFRKNNSAGEGFIRNRFSLGANTGAYYNAGFVTLVLDVGYLYGLHNITSKNERFETAGEYPYSLGDIKLNKLYANLSFLFSLEKKRYSPSTKCYYPYR